MCYFFLTQRDLLLSCEEADLGDAASSICRSRPRRCLCIVRGSTETIFLQLTGLREDLTLGILFVKLFFVLFFPPFVVVVVFGAGDSFSEGCMCVALFSCLYSPHDVLACFFVFFN